MYTQEDYLFPGDEDLELSTNILIRKAKKRGLRVEILDRKENFICLSKGQKIEYIKQASKTSLDTYISFCIMEDKNITKIILEKNNFYVPKGFCYDKIEFALKDYEKILSLNKKFIVKPTTTNYGIGISTLPPLFPISDYKKALEISFSLSQQTIIEEFIHGKEYRFFIVGEECVAVCERIPANVIGDGKSTIEELVVKKNKDPRRGVGHISPLEKIQLTATELNVLKYQNLNLQSIPKINEKIFLRENSNVSTGGEPIDLTNEMPKYFKDICIQASKTVGAKLCGVDLIVPNLNAKDYSLLELNFNPTIYIHEFPYEGQSRPVADKILDTLGF